MVNEKITCSRWLREYAERGFKNDVDTIRLSHENTPEHNQRVTDVCLSLHAAKIPFYTEVRLKCGLRPDIVCPTHVFQIIEVLHTETPLDFEVKKARKLPPALRDEVLLISTGAPWIPSSVL